VVHIGQKFLVVARRVLILVSIVFPWRTICRDIKGFALGIEAKYDCNAERSELSQSKIALAVMTRNGFNILELYQRGTITVASPFPR
jgi:hypothetical protein